MKKILYNAAFFLVVGFMSLIFPNDKASITTKEMPLLISYRQPVPPDSIQDFIKVYLQSKKMEIIDSDRFMELFKESFSANMMDAINSNKLNSETAKELPYSPICNSLVLRIFASSKEINNSQVIDSIKWAIKVLPSKDTSLQWKNYYPNVDANNNNNVFKQLKNFTEYVMESKVLK